MNVRISKLQKWAQRYIQCLEDRIAYVEKTIPWTEPGIQWFTLFRPGPQIKDRALMKLFTSSSEGTHCVCALGPQDWLFIGKGKKKPDNGGIYANFSCRFQHDPQRQERYPGNRGKPTYLIWLSVSIKLTKR